MFGSFDLQRSKSRPLTFLLGAASCLALIKPCKHPNHQAASAHINPPSFLPQFCRLCNSAYYSFKALSQNCFFLHLMILKASLIQISTDEQECAVIAAG